MIVILPCTYIVPALSSVVVTSNKFQPVGSDFIATCTVELGPSVVDSDLSLLMVDAQLSRDGTPLTLTGPTVAGTTFTYIIQLDSFGRNDSGNYTCTAAVRPQQPSTFLLGSSVLSNTVSIKAGMHHLCMMSRILNQCSVFLFFSSSCCSPSQCASHSGQCLCPSGGQLESSIWWSCYHHWLQDLLWQWRECISAFCYYWDQFNTEWKLHWSVCFHPF